jgi:glycosyltransferase involved in cell wall biosynthesis
MTTISIAMATYNGARFIREQLDSLAKQTVLPTELVVTDDGSNDDTLTIVEQFAKQAPFPVALHRNSKRLGYSANFMQCASLCRGELIAFSDQDDIWDQDKLRRVLLCFEETNAQVVFHGFRLVDQNGKNIGTLDEASPYKSIDHWTIVPGLTQVFRRELLVFSDLIEISIDPGAPSRPLAHDQWIYFLGHSFGSISYLKKCLLSYRQHGSNLFGLSPSGFERGSTFHQIVEPLTKALVGDTTLIQRKRKILHVTLFGRGISSASRVKILEVIRQRAGDASARPLSTHIEYYQGVSQALMLRAAIYEPDHILSRLGCMGTSIKNGAYSRNIRGLKDALLDIIFGVCLRPAEARKTQSSAAE